MRVCTLTHTYPRFDGDINAPFVEHLMETLAGQGVDVSVLTAHDPAWARIPADHTVDLATYRYIWPEKLHILGYSRTIEGNVRFRKRVMLLSPFLFTGAYRAFRRMVRTKKPDVLHAHWILPNGFIAGRVSRKTGIPLIIQTHGSDVFTAEKNALFRRMARDAGQNADCITAPSPDMIDRLAALGIDRRKLKLVPNAVQADFGDEVTGEQVKALKVKLDIPPDHLVLLAMGRMVHVKGFDYLLEAFQTVAAKHEKVTLVLAGDGVLFEDMRALARKLGIADRVIMPGAVMRAEVPVYFRMADLFVVPSIRHESGAVDGLPVVVPEAMASGLPVVASNVGGIPVLIRDGYNGLLVNERDPSAIADALERLFTDPALRDSYGRRSRTMISEAVNYDTVAEHFRMLFDAVLNGTSPERLPGFTIPLEDI